MKPDTLLRGALATAALMLFPVLQVSSAETVRFAHCLAGCPLGAAADSVLIGRSVYTLSFNRHTRVADWVAYEVTAGSIGVATNLSRTPRQDPYVTQTLSAEDFNAGDSENPLELNYFAPLVSFAGTPYRNEITYQTNVVPRHGELNRGPWYGLEWAVRNLANRNTDGLFVVTGPLYEDGKEQESLPTQVEHKVPSGFFKVVANRRGEVAAFTFDQDLPFHIHHCERLTSIAEVEKLSGLDLFPEQPDWPYGELARGLGCF